MTTQMSARWREQHDRTITDDGVACKCGWSAPTPSRNQSKRLFDWHLADTRPPKRDRYQGGPEASGKRPVLDNPPSVLALSRRSVGLV